MMDTEFPLDKDLLHLNHAAVSPWPRRTIDAITRFAEQNLHRGSWDYPAWLQTESYLRQQLTQLIAAPSTDDIALVKNTSEALSFVAAGVAWQPGDNIVSSDQEFPSNRIVWQSLASQGVSLQQVDLSSAPTPEDALFARVDSRTRMIAISSVQYASGLRMDLPRIGRFCREHGILFCVDAIQSVGAICMDVSAIEADFVAADGHKWMLGPEGLGFLYVRATLRDSLKLTQFGWHMVEAIGEYERTEWQPAASARRFECGSPNMLGIHALSASLSLLHELGMERVQQQVVANSRYLMEQLMAIPGIQLLTPVSEGRYAGIVSFYVEGHESPQLYQRLHAQGVFCANRGGGIRFSPHFYTSRAVLDQALARLRLLL